MLESVFSEVSSEGNRYHFSLKIKYLWGGQALAKYFCDMKKISKPCDIAIAEFIIFSLNFAVSQKKIASAYP